MSEGFPRLAPPVVLLGDADPGFRAMARDALRESTPAVELRAVASGPALLAGLGDGSAPALVVASCELPGAPGGLEVVRAVKCNVRRLPVVVLGPDEHGETVAAAYDAGANTYIAKPPTFLALVRVMKTFTAYWLDAALLPPAPDAA